MRSSTLTFLSLLPSVHAAHLPPARNARRVDQSINPRAEYIGGWAWSTSDTCSGSWSVSCGTSNNSCCPTGETCFGTGYGAYCCPTGTDCINKLLTLPACADQSMDMYLWPYYPRFFCCLPGLIAIIPYSGDGGLCLPADQNVPATAILTASQQIGVGISRTSMVPVVSATNPPSSGTITDYNPSTPTSSTTTCTTSPCVTDAATTTSPNKSNNSESGLSNSAIGGIAAAGVVIALLIWIYCAKRRSRKRQRKLDSASRMDVFPTPTVTQHSAAKPMYVSSGQPYFTPQPARDTDTSNTPAPHESANTQSPVPANAVPVSPLSSRVASPPPPYGSTPAAQYGELHGQAVGPGELDGNVVGGRGQGWWRTDGRESVTGRQEM
ncbi:hypothetical protein V490_02008 [Pseudogymnoascus sp. VKM F-3557]|nr:hypothetical protein V490_02008 [Pseudogymnoascus sp. VKM F-3557]